MAAARKTSKRASNTGDPDALARAVLRRKDATLEEIATAAARMAVHRATQEDVSALDIINLLVPMAGVIRARGKDGEGGVSEALAALFGAEPSGAKKKTVGRK